MIYTSYYAKLKKIPDNIVRINIALKKPRGINMLSYNKLYPTSNILYKYKNDINYGKIEYILDYSIDVLSKLDAKNVENELYNISNSEDIVLVCYEKSEDFCHRNLVSKWFNDNGIECKEWHD